MTDNIARWGQEHRNFMKLLGFLERQLEIFHNADAPNYPLMVDVLRYMTQYSDLFHHPKEDLIFARIKQRQGGAGEIVEDLANEHLVLRQSGEKLLDDLAGIMDGAALLVRENVERDGRAYIERLRGHMEREERELFPAAAELLSPQDWMTIDAAMPDRNDPLFGKDVEDRFKSLQRQVARDVASELQSLPG